MPRRADVARAVVAALLLVAACERSDQELGDDAAGETRVDSVTREAPTPVAPADSPAAGAQSDVEAGGGAATARALRAALERLVRGAVPDSATWFSARTADIVRSVEVDAKGHAVVDFVDLRPLIPNASSSAGSQMLLGQLNATVFAVPGVASVEYRMAGDCALLGEWLQYGTCLRFDRP